MKNTLRKKLQAGYYTIVALLFVAAIFATSSTATAQSCQAKFSFATQGLTAAFFDSSTAANSFMHFWEFGDGTKSDAKNPVHKYSTSGSYRVCLKIVDTIGKCSTSFCETVRVNVACNAAFQYSVSGYTVTLIADTINNKSTAKFSWKLGDGNFKTGAKVIYAYNQADTFEVCLTVTDSPCYQKTCKAIIINGNTNTTKYKISGKVDASGNAAYPGKVLLIVFNERDSSLKAIDTTNIIKDSLGAFYKFENVVPGIYYTKAILDSASVYYKNYMPTYWESSIKWAKSNKIAVTTANVINKNIHLQKGTNPGGKGFISGKISQGANKAAGDPLENIQVMLLNEDDSPVAYTFSDINGSYKFENLAYGKYQVYTEVLGLPTSPAWVELSEAKPEVKDVEVTINSKLVFTSVQEKPEEAITTATYPNPVKDVLNLNINSTSTQQAVLKMYSITGQLIQAKELKLIKGKQNLQLDTQVLQAGVYFVSVQISGKEVSQCKFIKAQ